MVQEDTPYQHHVCHCCEVSIVFSWTIQKPGVCGIGLTTVLLLWMESAFIGQMMENDSCFPIRVTLPFRNESCGSWFPSELNPYESYLSYIYIYHIYIYNVCVNIMKSMGFPTEHPSRFRRDRQAGADGSMAGVEEVAGVAVQNLDHHRVGHWAVAWPLRGREISNTAKSRGRTGKSMEITLTLCLWLTVRHGIDGPFIDDFPIKTLIHKGFSMAMLNNQMV